MNFKPGYYDFEGNTLYYEGYDLDVYDLDSGDYFPVEILVVSTFIGEEL